MRDWLKTANVVSVGPLEFKREIDEIADASRQLLKDRTRLQLLIAESCVIEVDVFLSYPLLSEEQRGRMLENLDKLKTEIKHLKQDRAMQRRRTEGPLTRRCAPASPRGERQVGRSARRVHPQSPLPLGRGLG
jgi:hypothetical protein